MALEHQQKLMVMLTFEKSRLEDQNATTKNEAKTRHDGTQL